MVLLETWGVELIAQYGVPTALVIFLVYFLTNQLNTKIDKLGEDIKQHTATIAFLAIVLAKAQGIDIDDARRMAGLGVGGNG